PERKDSLVSTHQLRGRDQFLARPHHLSSGGPHDPRCDQKRDEGIEAGAARDSDKKPRRDRRERYKHVTHVVEVGEADRGILDTRLQQEPGDSTVSNGRDETEYNRNYSRDRNRVSEPFNRLPYDQTAYRGESYGVEYIRPTLERAR